eukprot:Awhi_evm1s12799
MKCGNCKQIVDKKNGQSYFYDKWWHGYCFKCVICNASLETYDSFYRNGQLFCVDDCPGTHHIRYIATLKDKIKGNKNIYSDLKEKNTKNINEVSVDDDDDGDDESLTTRNGSGQTPNESGQKVEDEKTAEENDYDLATSSDVFLSAECLTMTPEINDDSDVTNDKEKGHFKNKLLNDSGKEASTNNTSINDSNSFNGDDDDNHNNGDNHHDEKQSKDNLRKKNSKEKPKFSIKSSSFEKLHTSSDQLKKSSSLKKKFNTLAGDRGGKNDDSVEFADDSTGKLSNHEKPTNNNNYNNNQSNNNTINSSKDNLHTKNLTLRKKRSTKGQSDLIKCNHCRVKIAVNDELYFSNVNNSLHWHQKCFSCYKCSLHFAVGQEFVTHPTKPRLFCLSCFSEKTRKESTDSLVCKKCCQTIEIEALEYQEDNYHLDCFSCERCDTQLDPSGFFISNDTGLKCCEICYANEMEVCHYCHKVCEGEYTMLQGLPYHYQCHRCYQCDKNLVDEKTFIIDKKPYCLSHALEISFNEASNMGSLETDVITNNRFHNEDSVHHDSRVNETNVDLHEIANDVLDELKKEDKIVSENKIAPKLKLEGISNSLPLLPNIQENVAGSETDPDYDDFGGEWNSDGNRRDVSGETIEEKDSNIETTNATEMINNEMKVKDEVDTSVQQVDQQQLKDPTELMIKVSEFDDNNNNSTNDNETNEERNGKVRETFDSVVKRKPKQNEIATTSTTITTATRGRSSTMDTNTLRKKSDREATAVKRKTMIDSQYVVPQSRTRRLNSMCARSVYLSRRDSRLTIDVAQGS